MSNYIEEFIKRMKDCANGNNCESCPYQYEGLTETETCKEDLIYDAAEEFERLYSRIPSKGELVRCGECKYYSKYRCPNDMMLWTHICALGCGTCGEDWFCADGERKDGAE